MDPYQHLPFRNSEIRSSRQSWPAPSQPDAAFAIASSLPQQKFPIAHVPHQHHDDRLNHFASTAVNYGYAIPHSPAPTPPVLPVLQYNAPQHHAYQTPHLYPVMPLPPPMSAPAQSAQRILPLPSKILLSQDSQEGPCLACNRPGCGLQSHRHFSKYMLEDARRKKRAEEQGDRADDTPRPRTAVPALQVIDGPVLHLPLGLDPEREYLFALWSREWSPVKRGPEKHLFPGKLVDRIVPIARNHPPLLHAFLAYSGMLFGLANNAMGELAARQQAYAVEVLSQTCPSEQDASTDEAMLAATLLMLIYMGQGNGFEVNKHLSGLVHLTKVRGGPHYLSALTSEVLVHADHMQAIFFNHEPVWHLPLPPLEIGLPQSSGKGFRKAIEAHDMDHRLILAAGSVCKIADMYDYERTRVPLPSSARNSFNYLFSIMTYQLACCNATYHSSATTSECLCLALLLFHHVILCNDGATTPHILQIEYRFWETLETIETKDGALGLAPCMYMWMVATGLTVGIRGNHSQYWPAAVDRLRASRTSAGLDTWDKFKTNVLDDFVWLPAAQEEMLMRLWSDVEGAKTATGLNGFHTPGVATVNGSAALKTAAPSSVFSNGNMYEKTKWSLAPPEPGG